MHMHGLLFLKPTQIRQQCKYAWFIIFGDPDDTENNANMSGVIDYLAPTNHITMSIYMVFCFADTDNQENNVNMCGLKFLRPRYTTTKAN